MIRKLAVVWAVVVLAGCGFVAPEAPGEKVGSKLARVTSNPDDSVFASTVSHNTDVALTLYKQLRQENQNLFYSPHSIQVALSLVYAGAAGESAKALEQTFQIENADDYHLSMNALDRALASRGKSSAGANGEPFSLRIANHLFVDSTVTLKPSYLDVLAQQYGTDGRKLDFIGQPDASRVSINKWVASMTNDRIKDLLGEGSVTTDTRLTVVNAMYFSAAWKTGFKEEWSAAQDFHTLDGAVVKAPFMAATEVSLRTDQTDAYLAVSLPYQGDELSFVAIMPKNFDEFETGLTAEKLKNVVDELSGTSAEVHMPKFELDSSFDLTPTLKAIGLTSLVENTDLSNLSDERLALQFAVHKAWVKVSESGTQAAAATAIGFGLTSVSVPKIVTLDRPFIFFIRDDATGAILFAGRYVKPQ